MPDHGEEEFWKDKSGMSIQPEQKNETVDMFDFGDVVEITTQQLDSMFPVGTIGLIIEKTEACYIVEDENGLDSWAYLDCDLKELE